MQLLRPRRNRGIDSTAIVTLGEEELFAPVAIAEGSWRGHFLWLSSCMSFIRHHKARLPELSSSPYQRLHPDPALPLLFSSSYPLSYASSCFSENQAPKRRTTRAVTPVTCRGTIVVMPETSVRLGETAETFPATRGEDSSRDKIGRN